MSDSRVGGLKSPVLPQTSLPPPDAPKPKKKAPADCNETTQLSTYSGACANELFGAASTDQVRERGLVNDSLKTARDFATTPNGANREAFLRSLEALPNASFKELMSELKDAKDGRFEAIMGHLASSSGARQAFLELAVQKGFLEATPAKGAPPSGPIVAPNQPPLVRNDPALPEAMRQLIHSENQTRAAQYLKAFDDYTHAWCAAVSQARSPQEIRALGPFSTPPALSEPGFRERDRKDFGWNAGLTPSAPNLEKAQRAIGDRIGDLREQPRAGSYGVEADGSAKVARPSGVEFGGAVEVTRNSAGTKVETKGKVGAQVEVETESPAPGLTQAPFGFSVGRSVDTNGTTTTEVTGALGAFGVGIEAERKTNGETKKTFTAQALENVGAYASVDSNGNTAAGLEFKGGGKVGDTKMEFGLKVGLTAYSVPREYYQDFGGAQPGIFGPMPELDNNVPWTALKPDRRAWYERQGFKAENWGAR
jgi:hypothetical protein